jgi:hypothetical protein
MFVLFVDMPSEEEEELATPLHVVNTDLGEMPEGASLTDGEDEDARANDDPHRALDIDLDEYEYLQSCLLVMVNHY